MRTIVHGSRESRPDCQVVQAQRLRAARPFFPTTHVSYAHRACSRKPARLELRRLIFGGEARAPLPSRIGSEIGGAHRCRKAFVCAVFRVSEGPRSSEHEQRMSARRAPGPTLENKLPPSAISPLRSTHLLENRIRGSRTSEDKLQYESRYESLLAKHTGEQRPSVIHLTWLPAPASSALCLQLCATIQVGICR